LARPAQQNPNTSVYQVEMFRLDPNGERSIEEVIAKLTDALAELPPDSPRAQRLADMIRGLREMADRATSKWQPRLVAGD
jgi:hypothetical protein